MSRGSGKIERRIGELFAATRDRALSVGDVAAHAFRLKAGVAPNRKQRLSATRAAHRLLRRAALATEAAETALNRAIAETVDRLGRPPGRRRNRKFSIPSRLISVDNGFYEEMKAAPSWPAWQQASQVLEREWKRFDGVLILRGGWRATETNDRRLWFHPADYPVRVWAVDIRPQGVMWDDTESVRVDNAYVHVRYLGESARLGRSKLARSWSTYRTLYFASSRSGRAAGAFNRMWRRRYPRQRTAARDAVAAG